MNDQRIVLDVPKLRKELEYITANRVQWHQKQWLRRTSCGTVGCLAGNVAINAGYLPVYLDASNRLHTEYVSPNRVPTPTETTREFARVNEVERVRTVAARELGLTDVQAGYLFSASNTLYDLWAYARDFSNGEIEIPIDVERDHADTSGSPVPTGANVVARDEDAKRVLTLRQGFVTTRVRSSRIEE